VADTTSGTNGAPSSIKVRPLMFPCLACMDGDWSTVVYVPDEAKRDELITGAFRATDGNIVWIFYPLPPALVARADDAATAARLNAETISGLQVAKEAAEAGERCYYQRLGKAVVALRDLVKQMRDEESNREEGIFADLGCRECTHGTTPDRYHTGPCARHRAEALLRALEVQGVGAAALKAVPR